MTLVFCERQVLVHLHFTISPEKDSSFDGLLLPQLLFVLSFRVESLQAKLNCKKEVFDEICVTKSWQIKCKEHFRGF